MPAASIQIEERQRHSLTLQRGITHTVRGTLRHPRSRYAYTSWIMSPSAFSGSGQAELRGAAPGVPMT